VKKDEILAGLIEEVLSGKSPVEDCAARFPSLEKELRSLLQLAKTLSPEKITPTSEFKEHAAKRLAEEMQPFPSKTTGSFWHFPHFAPANPLAMVLIALFILTAGGGSTVYAAQRSLPGDTIYPVKTGIENIQLALTPGAIAKARLHLRLMQRRINEASQQVKANRKIDTQTVDIIGKQMDDTVAELSKVKSTEVVDEMLGRLSSATLDQQMELKEAMDDASKSSLPALTRALTMARRSNLIAQVAYDNRDYLSRLPSVRDEKIDNGQFKIDGTINSIQGRTWNVGGVLLNNVYLTKTPPVIGCRIVIEGVVKDREIFISRIEVYENSSGLTSMEGKFGGINANGTTNIGGIPVTVDDGNSSMPDLGARVLLQGNAENSNLSITTQIDRPNDDISMVGQSGTLVAVNYSNSEITVSTAGSQIVINISEARIEAERGRLLRFIELRRMVGLHVKLDGLFRKEGRLFVRRIQVEN
jgi:hypothetical protein